MLCLRKVNDCLISEVLIACNELTWKLVGFFTSVAYVSLWFWLLLYLSLLLNVWVIGHLHRSGLYKVDRHLMSEILVHELELVPCRSWLVDSHKTLILFIYKVQVSVTVPWVNWRLCIFLFYWFLGWAGLKYYHYYVFLCCLQTPKK